MNWINDYLQAIQNNIPSAKILKATDEITEMLLNKYPFEFGRIDWTKVRRFAVLYAPACRANKGRDAGADAFTFGQHTASICEFISNMQQKLSIDDHEKIYIVGDMMDVCIQTVLLEAKKYIGLLLGGTPQHIYIFPVNCNWCINYTMEDNLYCAWM